MSFTYCHVLFTDEGNERNARSERLKRVPLKLALKRSLVLKLALKRSLALKLALKRSLTIQDRHRGGVSACRA